MSESLSELAEDTSQLPNMSLSNEKELLAACPHTFFENNNPWTIFATKVYAQGATFDGWPWKKRDDLMLEHLVGLFAAFGQTPTLQTLEKCAFGGWVLSEILESIPTHISRQKTN